MKKIILLTITLLILIMAFASCDTGDNGGDDKPTITGYYFNRGEFVEGTSWTVIITNDLYPEFVYAQMNNISGNENLFEDLRTGDKIKITFTGDIKELGAPIISVYGYELIERGNIENIIKAVPENTWELWKSAGWIDGIIRE